MADHQDVILGRVALSAGMITASQFEALRGDLKKAAGATTEQVLLKAGAISADQARALQEMRGSKGLFGQIAVKHGFVTPEQLSAARARQVELEAAGQIRQLGEVMVELRMITPAQIQRILELQKKRPMVCAVCDRHYQVLPTAPAVVLCPRCHVKLEPPESAAGAFTAQEATVIAEVSGIGGRAPAGKTPEVAGKTLAGVKIHERIGSGAMGTVYRGTHVALGRPVAVKIVPAGGHDQLVVRRLLFEARAIAKLNHPNIVQVYDAGIQQGQLFLVMQYIEGGTLESHLKESGPMMEEAAIAMTRGILAGLGAAHAAGIVHRDLKPANIMLDAGERPRILDFGLARDRAKVDEVAEMMVGTPYFMAPEQWLGRKTDERTDLYAVGVILFWMLTGQKPFDSKNLRQLMEMHVKKAPPPLRKLRPAVSRGIEAIVKKVLSKGPSRRYPNAEEFARDLSREEPEALAQMGRTIKCGFCEALNPEGSTRCSVCNEAVGAKAMELTLVARANEFRCPSCKGFVTIKAHACPHCQKAFCTGCRRRLAAQGGLCVHCLKKRTSA